MSRNEFFKGKTNLNFGGTIIHDKRDSGESFKQYAKYKRSYFLLNKDTLQLEV